jgi:hypothetical protein
MGMWRANSTGRIRQCIAQGKANRRPTGLGSETREAKNLFLCQPTPAQADARQGQSDAIDTMDFQPLKNALVKIIDPGSGDQVIEMILKTLKWPEDPKFLGKHAQKKSLVSTRVRQGNCDLLFIKPFFENGELTYQHRLLTLGRKRLNLDVFPGSAPLQGSL